MLSEEGRRRLEQRLDERRRQYLRFLRSPEWRAACRRVQEKANYLCAVCGTSENLQTHHDLDGFPLANRPEAPANLPGGWLPAED